MFNNGITPEAIPERIYKFSKFVAENNLSKNELKDFGYTYLIFKKKIKKVIRDVKVKLGLKSK